MGTRPPGLSDIDAFLAMPGPSPTPRPSPLASIDAFLAATPSPSPTPNPLDRLFASPSPSPLAPPVGPDQADELEIPGSEPEPSMAERVQRMLESFMSPIPAIQAAMQRTTTAAGTNLETSDKDPGRPLNLPGPTFLPPTVRAALRGAHEGLMEEAVPSVTTPFDIATLPAALPAQVVAKLGKGGAGAFRAARAIEKAGAVMQGTEGVQNVAQGISEGDPSKIGLGLFHGATAGLMARGPNTLEGALAADAPRGLSAEDVAAAITRDRLTRTGGPAQGNFPLPGPPPLPKPKPKPPTPEQIRAQRIDHAIGELSAGASTQSTLLMHAGRQYTGPDTVEGRLGPVQHHGKMGLGLTTEEFPQNAATLREALEKLKEGKKSALGERLLKFLETREAEALAEHRAAQSAENVEKGRASFDPDALDLPTIEGAAHGVDDDYTGIVLSAANTHLGPVQGTGVVSTVTPTGQNWYGMKGQDGNVSAALSITKAERGSVATDWVGSDPMHAGLVVRRALKEHPDLLLDFDSLSPDSARVLNRVMNSGTPIGEAVRGQWEAHLRETGRLEDGGTVPPEAPNGSDSSGGSSGGGGTGGRGVGNAPETVVEQGRAGPATEGGRGSGGAPPRQPPGTEAAGVAPEPVDPVKKLLNLIRQAPRAIKETEGLRMEERIRRSSEISRALNATGGREGLAQARSKAAGELPQSQFEPVGPRLTEAETTEILNRAQRHPDLQPFERLRAGNAVLTILDGGRLPQRNEIILLERVFGSEMTDALLSRRSTWTKAKAALVDAANLPRSFVSSFDMSAPFRQGLLLTVGRPRQAVGAARHMFSAAFSQRIFDAVEKEIRARPNAELYDANGLYLTSNTRAAGLAPREESFMSRFAERVPVIGAGVRASERAYVGYLNKIRADVFDSVTAEWAKAGVTPETAPSRYKGLAEYINMATGRGSLGKLERIAPMMNAAFFSPRFMMARLQTLNPATYARMDPAVRKQAARDITATLGAGLAVLSMAKMAGAEVETDPRSSDFGKIRVGRTRMDVWGGFQQPMRYLAQMVTGERKPENGGIQPQRDRVETAGRFLRSKESPAVSAGHDLLSGKDFIGNEVTWESEAKEMFSPMFFGDFQDAVREHGFAQGAALAAPAFLGVGVTTHHPRGESARQ